MRGRYMAGLVLLLACVLAVASCTLTPTEPEPPAPLQLEFSPEWYQQEVSMYQSSDGLFSIVDNVLYGSLSAHILVIKQGNSLWAWGEDYGSTPQLISDPAAE